MKIELLMHKILSFDQYLLEGKVNESASFEEKVKALINSFYNSIKSTQVEELPRGSNKGPKIVPLLRNAGANPGDPWCAAFVHEVLTKTALSSDIKKTIPKTPGVLSHWEKTGAKKLEYKSEKNIDKILPGMVFCYLTKGSKGTYPGKGHTGIVMSVDKSKKSWTGVEGNANPSDGSREGYGTFIVTRNIKDPSISKDSKDHPAKLLGFIDYFADYRNIVGFTEALTAKLGALTNVLLPKTNKEIAYLKANPQVLKDYEENYNNRKKA